MSYTGEWLVIGGPVAPVSGPNVGPTGEPVATAYAELMAQFGPGTFNGFVRVSKPEHLQTVQDRLRMPDPLLAQHVVFADSDNGDMLTWDLAEGAASRVYRFAPRSFSPEPIARTSDELVLLLATVNVVFARGPVTPFFVPAGVREKRHLRFSGARPDNLGLGEWVDESASLFHTVLLDRDYSDEGPGWSSVTLLVGETIVDLQHTGYKHAGWWTIAFDSPVGTDLAPLIAWLEHGAKLGWTPAQTKLAEAPPKRVGI